MKLIEALSLIQKGRAATGEPLTVLVACGFTPLHLGTFLTAHLQVRFPARPVNLRHGLYGDLAGTLERAGQDLEAAAVVVEWADLDPRLGVRGAGGWRPALLGDISRTVLASVARLRGALESLAARCPVAVCGPTLPLPPVAHTAGWQASAFELELLEAVAALRAWAARQDRIRVVRPQRLDEVSAPAERLDVAGELKSGFPYRLAHADHVAGLLAALVENRPPKKGLISDLDDTLWNGLLGEVGAAGIKWDLAGGAHLHALYQQLLASLAESGTLVGVASKNDPALVEEAFGRRDLLVSREAIHPVQASWGPKSEAVRQILRAWNIGADSVVFVDDAPMELGEVAAAHPGIECVLFPKDDPEAAWAVLERLRDLFGKPRISSEDGLRASSLRQAAAAPEAGSPGFEEFLAGAQAEVTFDLRLDVTEPRALELVNKTNQFNLNGRRYSDVQWQRLLGSPGAFLLHVAYTDRFGPLGTIAVAAGRAEGETLSVDAWVMSCRAFSRRIEHQTLRVLFERFGAASIALDYAKTDRNGPLQEFLADLLGSSPPAGGLQLRRKDFEATCPPLHHTVHEVLPDG
jgi:FkbH-like protein